jgi:hypothetical protein
MILVFTKGEEGVFFDIFSFYGSGICRDAPNNRNGLYCFVLAEFVK